ncbi:hypothetical protein [Streptomyces sp. NBC_00572]|uniref:hypothetical protein n=1 Tax=Streptomyces sp. NBC_00572 TaxID=2903664 RepID=UPI002258B459|nr:hypothetical protein [Streptomyces sp. NBC_00572]MCX4984539.1 hypothetical protein [Streptomyces sp. NBC_00572]
MSRLRLTVAAGPRRALVLTDTPQPECQACEGWGDYVRAFNDLPSYREYAEWETCACWDANRRWVLLPLPSLPRHRTPVTNPRGPGGYSDEPPF